MLTLSELALGEKAFSLKMGHDKLTGYLYIFSTLAPSANLLPFPHASHIQDKLINKLGHNSLFFYLLLLRLPTGFIHTAFQNKVYGLIVLIEIKALDLV